MNILLTIAAVSLLLLAMPITVEITGRCASQGKITVIVHYLVLRLRREFDYDWQAAAEPSSLPTLPAVNTAFPAKKQLTEGLSLAVPVVKRLLAGIHLKKLEASCRIGLDDKYHLAVLSGLCWGLLGGLTPILPQNARILYTPDFDHNGLRLDFDGIISTSPGHIISSCLAALALWIKQKRSISNGEPSYQ